MASSLNLNFHFGQQVAHLFGHKKLHHFHYSMEFIGNLVYQGAESRVYESVYIDRPVIIKERLSKSYRVKELDKKINRHRLQQEIKCMVKCRRAGVATPR